MHRAKLAFCKQMAHGLAQQFGPNCEIVVHDLVTDLEHSIVAIENGHVTGRKLGDGPSPIVLEALRADPDSLTDRSAYLTKSDDGRILKSSTFYIRDDNGKVVGIFGLNYDISFMMALGDTIRSFTQTNSAQPEPAQITHNVNDLLAELIEQSVRHVGRPVAVMTKEDKIRAIQFLNDAGAFLITKSGDKVCKFFGISKYTLYSYLDESKNN